MKIDVQTAGLEKFAERMERYPAVAHQAATLAINKAAKRARTAASLEIRKQVNLTTTYLNNDRRLWVSKYARNQNLSAVISARLRPTQLIRYGASQLTRKGKRKGRVNAGVSVKVSKAGARVKIRQAFFMRLKSGKKRGGNMGIAVRSLDGLNKDKFVGVSKQSAGVYVLYGPSIDQVFNTVRSDISPEISKFLLQEFNRQYARLL